MDDGGNIGSRPKPGVSLCGVHIVAGHLQNGGGHGQEPFNTDHQATEIKLGIPKDTKCIFAEPASRQGMVPAVIDRPHTDWPLGMSSSKPVSQVRVLPGALDHTGLVGIPGTVPGDLASELHEGRDGMDHSCTSTRFGAMWPWAI